VRLTDNAQKELTIMSVNIYTNYFVDRLTANHARLQEGNLGRYEYYESYSHDSQMNINDHRFKLVYKLRIEIADKEGNALPVPNVIMGVTFEAYEDESVSVLSPSASKSVDYNVKLTKTEFLEQVAEAIEKFKSFIEDFPIPQLEFDFWPQTAKLMKQFDRQASSTARDNSDFLSLK
jgi:hypothetical protein